MLRELVEAAHRLRAEDRLPPSGTREKPIVWLIDVDKGEVVGPYNRSRRDQPLLKRVPDLFRGGQPSPTNLKPYLLVDDARYALGIAEAGRADEAMLLHGGFMSLLADCASETHDKDVLRVLDFLSRPLPLHVKQVIQPRDIVTFRTPSPQGDYAFEHQLVRDFWGRHLEKEHTGSQGSACGSCGQIRPTVRILPQRVEIAGQQCQITSFNKTAFNSRGKEQTANAPLCYPCVSDSTDALNYFIDTPRHRVLIVRDQSKGAKNSLRNQLAVFWLRDQSQLQHAGEALDPLAVFDAIDPSSLMRDEHAEVDTAGPPPDLSQVERLVTIPWHASEAATRLNTNSFHLAVLSANKGRLVVREWITERLDLVVANLKRFLDATRIVEPFGEAIQPLSIKAMLTFLKSNDPHLSRGLLRTAYLGVSPPREMLAEAVKQFRARDKPPTRPGEAEEQIRRRHALAGILKLVLTYNTEDAQRMERLDTSRNNPAYLCGRLLAIIEETQARASRGGINRTVVDRYYGAASLTPATTLGSLVRLTEIAHLSKLRREGRNYWSMRELMEQVIDRFDADDGMPRTLRLHDQADFALGFYQQRAEFSREREASRLKNQQIREEQ